MKRNNKKRKEREEQTEQINNEGAPNKLQKLQFEDTIEVDEIEVKDWVNRWNEEWNRRSILAKSAYIDALRHYEKKEYNKVIEECKKMVKYDPNNKKRRENCGFLYLNMGYDKKALKHFKKAVELAPNDEEFLDYIIGYLKFAGKYEEAIEFYQRLIELNPKDCSTLIELSKCYEKLGKYDEALEKFHFILSIMNNNNNNNTNNNKSEIYARIGIINLKIGKSEEAMKYINESISLRPNDTLNFYNIGVALFIVMKYEESLQYFQKSLEIHPSDNRSRSILIKSFLKLKRYDDVIKMKIKYLDFVSKINPLIDTSQAYIRKKEFDTAEELIEIALKEINNYTCGK